MVMKKKKKKEKKRKNSRKKGATFERDVAKLFSDWTGMKFRRTPMSGGWAKTGDITPVNPKEMDDFRFNVECKNQQIWSFADLIKDIHSGSGIESWWIQAANDAEKSKKVPLLVFTRNRDVNYIMLTENLYKRLAFDHSVLMEKSYQTMRWCQFRIMLLDMFLLVNYEKASKIATEMYYDNYGEVARNN